jgi:hypothetical protein
MIDDRIIREAIQWDTAGWFEGFGKIERKNGDLVSPRANVYQLRISDIIRWCHENGRPCRLVCLKPRQKGSSTFSVAAMYRRLLAKRGRGLIAGGAHFQGQNLFKILNTYAKNDDLDPKSCKVMDTEARFTNGSTIERITLANPNAGRSGTYQTLIITEVAYLAEEGVANATNVLNGLLKCVPYEADTVIIQESTAKGAQGDFFETWEAGISFDDLKAGKNGYVQVFAAWFEFDDSRMEPTSEGIHSDADLTAEERDLADRHNLDHSQIAWMRWAIREECKGDFDRFSQDYPFDPETAFLKSGRGAFDAKGLAYQEELVPLRPREFGYLDYNPRADRVAWVPCAEAQARCVRWETPRVGCRYLISVDQMTGEDQTGGEDPDSHAVFVIRDGYLDRGRWIEPAVVMRNMLVPGKKEGSLCCWWAIDVLEEVVWRMARYWQAIIVPEMNMDRGLVELLKQRIDVAIYEREMFNRRENVLTKALGWMTDKTTRPMMLDNFYMHVREAGRGQTKKGVEVRCPWAIKQMKNFVVKKSGRAEASAGQHDDDVLSLAIGWQNLDMATPWNEINREEWIPRDLRGGHGVMQMEARRSVSQWG